MLKYMCEATGQRFNSSPATEQQIYQLCICLKERQTVEIIHGLKKKGANLIQGSRGNLLTIFHMPHSEIHLNILNSLNT